MAGQPTRPAGQRHRRRDARPVRGDGSEQPAYRNTVVARTPYVNSSFPRYILRLRRAYPAHVFATAPIPLDPAKRVRSLTLPASWDGGGVGHVFSYAVS